MSHRYVVLGAGRQGLAAAYDMVVHGSAGQVVVADLDGEAARAAVCRLDELTGRAVAETAVVDVSDRDALVESCWAAPTSC